MKLSAILLAGFILACSAQALELRGGWKGTWTKDGDALPVTVSIEKTAHGYRGSFDSDVLQVAGVPFSEVDENGRKVHMVLEGDTSTTVFDGTLGKDLLSGTFVEGRTNGKFSLRRASLPAASIRTREVKIRSGDVTLAGTLLLPKIKGKHRAVLFLQGSGPEGRWANRYLAKKFAEAGFVALVYDKRGVGLSEGDWQRAGFDVLAGDAVNGVRLLRTLPEVNPARVGIYGHSQGGTIAPMVASLAGHLGFVIASAAGGISPADMEIYSVSNSIGISRLPAAEKADARAYVRELIAVAYRGASRQTLSNMAMKFKDRAWYFDPPPVDNPYWTLSSQFADFDPPKYWRLVKAPVLLLYGDHDERVPPYESADAIETALRAGGNYKVTLRYFPNSDHTFTIVEPAHKTGWPRHEPSYAAILVNWALAQR